jgi:rhamnulose-1-phosphate aldolase
MHRNQSAAAMARPWLDQVAATARFLVERGWAEANAGNLSLRVAAGKTVGGPLIELPVAVPALIGSCLVVKRAGARLRDLANAPGQGLCVVCITGPRTGRLHGGPPSSELAAHLAAHAALVKARPADRVFLHTHPTDLAALSLLVGHQSLPGLLARVHTEAPVLLEGRLTALPLALPGSVSLARTTARALARYQAVAWPAHGVAASGPDFGSALDLVELADKCARIALLAGARPANRIGLSPAQRRAVRRSFGLKP